MSGETVIGSKNRGHCEKIEIGLSGGNESRLGRVCEQTPTWEIPRHRQIQWGITDARITEVNKDSRTSLQD